MSQLLFVRVLGILALACCFAASCSKDDDDQKSSLPPNISGKEACDFLGEYCHPVDDYGAELHECHEIGHRQQTDQCLARYDACKSMCEAAREDAGLPLDGGEGGAPSEGGAGGGDRAHGGAAGGGAHTHAGAGGAH